MRSLIGNWLDAVGERLTLAEKIGMAAIVIALALAAAPLGWIARRFVYRDPGRRRAEPAAPGARRRLDIRDLRGAAARRPRRAGGRARLLQPLRSEHAGRHRRRVRGGARADRRQCAWPRRARARARGLAAHSDERPVGGDRLSPRDGDRGDLGGRAADRAGGRRRRLAQHRGRRRGAWARSSPRSRSPTRCASSASQPAGAQGSPQNEAWAPLENARLGGRA